MSETKPGPLTDEELTELERILTSYPREGHALVYVPDACRLLSELRALRELRELARRVITEPVGIATAPSNGHALRAMLDKLMEMHLKEHP